MNSSKHQWVLTASEHIRSYHEYLKSPALEFARRSHSCWTSRLSTPSLSSLCHHVIYSHASIIENHHLHQRPSSTGDNALRQTNQMKLTSLKHAGCFDVPLASGMPRVREWATHSTFYDIQSLASVLTAKEDTRRVLHRQGESMRWAAYCGNDRQRSCPLKNTSNASLEDRFNRTRTQGCSVWEKGLKNVCFLVDQNNALQNTLFSSLAPHGVVMHYWKRSNVRYSTSESNPITPWCKTLTTKLWSVQTRANKLSRTSSIAKELHEIDARLWLPLAPESSKPQKSTTK